MSFIGPVTVDPLQQERRARWKWLAIIVGLMVIQFAMSMVAIYLATSNPRQSIVPNYHQKALHWDERAASHRASTALGWQWEVTPSDQADIYGQRLVTLRLRDAQGHPMEQALVTLELMHHAHGREVQRLELLPVPRQPGVYQSSALLRHRGVWQLDLRAARGEQVFLATAQQNWQFPQESRPQP